METKRVNKAIDTLRIALMRNKKTVGLDPILNSYINSEFEKVKHKFIFVGENLYNSEDPNENFEKLKTYNRQGQIPIWTGASDNTIFGDPIVNAKFRALHDLAHLATNNSFTLEGETETVLYQIANLPKGKEFDCARLLLEAEVIGQSRYYFANGGFIEEQRLFAIQYLINPLKALGIADFKEINLVSLAKFARK